jgi:hypothetical protein
MGVFGLGLLLGLLPGRTNKGFTVHDGDILPDIRFDRLLGPPASILLPETMFLDLFG